MKKKTEIIHGYTILDNITGASSIPKYQASTFHQKSLTNINEYTYTRFENPTVNALENALAILENGKYATAFSSGMSAISAVFLLLSKGEHIVLASNIYGGTYQLVIEMMNRFSIDYTFIENSLDINNWKNSIKATTKMVYIETPSNPLLEITDIKAVCDYCKEKGILTVCDNTFMTPYFQKPLNLGADIVINSATKFLNGHSDVVAGAAISNNPELDRQIKKQRRILGSILGVEDSWLLMRGIKTLGIRMEQIELNTNKIFSYLKTNSKIERLFYPFAENNQGKTIHQKQSTGGGGVISFDLGNRKNVDIFLSKVTLPILAVSLGGVESILSYPWSMSHGMMSEEEKTTRGISDGLLRLSVGIEDSEDLILDLNHALSFI